MAVTLKETEGFPTYYPDEPDGLSVVEPDALWQRIESYISHRFTPRSVVWTVEGPGEWEPPLFPATLTSIELWESGAWVECFAAASPYGGYDLAGEGPYRISASVGSGYVPAVVLEAFRRLAEYCEGDPDERAGTSSYSVNIGGVLEESYQRSPTWAARALQNSGAADLLRPFKRRKA